MNLEIETINFLCDCKIDRIEIVQVMHSPDKSAFFQSLEKGKFVKFKLPVVSFFWEWKT